MVSRKTLKGKRGKSRKTRRLPRKLKGGAFETIRKPTLKEIRDEIAKVNPTAITLIRQDSEETEITTKNGGTKKIYTDEEIDTVETENFEKLIKKYNITNDKLVKNPTNILPNDKGKYFFTYLK